MLWHSWSDSMKRFLPALIVLLLLSASALPAQDRTPVSEAEKLERTKAILAENSSAAAGGKQRTQSPWNGDTEQGFGAAGASMFKSLAFCLGILLVGLAVYRKLNRRNETGGSKRIRVLEKVPLTHRSVLVLLEVDGRKIVASAGQDHVSFLNMDGGAKEENTFEQSLKEVCVKER